MAELADARDLKSRDTRVSYRFETGFRHQKRKQRDKPPVSFFDVVAHVENRPSKVIFAQTMCV